VFYAMLRGRRQRGFFAWLPGHGSRKWTRSDRLWWSSLAGLEREWVFVGERGWRPDRIGQRTDWLRAEIARSELGGAGTQAISWFRETGEYLSMEEEANL